MCPIQSWPQLQHRALLERVRELLFRTMQHAGQQQQVAVPVIPTQPPAMWSQCAAAMEQLPHTGPISQHRGRSLAERLQLLLPERGQDSKQQGKHGHLHPTHHAHQNSSAQTQHLHHPPGKCSHAALMQLRYCLHPEKTSYRHGENSNQHDLPNEPCDNQHQQHKHQHHKHDGSGRGDALTRPDQQHQDRQHKTLAEEYTPTADLGLGLIRRVYNKHLLTEDFDTFAADVAARHVGEGHTGRALVTAFLDSLVWFRDVCDTTTSKTQDTKDPKQSPIQSQPLPQTAPDHPTQLDLFMTGQVTWVGRSSLEVTVEVTQGQPSSQASDSPLSLINPGPAVDSALLVARARFVMACRDASLRKSVVCPPLLPEGDAEQRLYAEGAARQQARQAGRKQEAKEDMAALHELLHQLAALQPVSQQQLHQQQQQKQEQQQQVTTSAAAGATSQSDILAPADSQLQLHKARRPKTDVAGRPITDPQHLLSVLQDLAATGIGARTMQSTHCTQSFFTQYRDRNTTGTVFGGTLLRYGMDMGAVVLAGLLGPDPHAAELLVLRDVAFMSLVPLGHWLHLSGYVVATQGQLVVIKAAAYKYDDASHLPTQHVPAARVPGHSKHADQQVQQAEGTHHVVGSAHGQAINAAKALSDRQHQQADEAQQPGHQKHDPIQTHSYWLIYRARDGVMVPPVLPQDSSELREWLHGMHLCQTGVQ